MGVSLGIWLMRLLHEAQTARNSLYPDLINSPVVIFTAMSLSMSLDQLLMLENVPLSNMVTSLVALAMTLGPLLADSVSPSAEGCSDWSDGPAAPSQAQIQREMEMLREQLVSAVPDIVQRRLHADAPA